MKGQTPKLVLDSTTFKGSTDVWRVSLRAIEMAYSFGEKNARRLAAILYFYNRIPVSSKWKERIPDESALLRFLGIGKDGSWPGCRNIHPAVVESNDSVISVDSYWRIWEIDGRSSARRSDQPGFKLYISPHCDDLPALIGVLGGILESSGAHTVKIGRNVQAILRPDKLMVYFSRLDDAIQFARRLVLTACVNRAHVVPFAYPLDSIGLVSLGFDPPSTAGWVYGDEGRSWRLWVTEHVATAILKTQRRRSSNPIDAVLGEVVGNGIDPYLWGPLDSSWGMGACA